MYALERLVFQETGCWKQCAVCGRPELLERVRLGQECPEHWRVTLENTCDGTMLPAMKKAG